MGVQPLVDDLVHANLYLDDTFVMRKRLNYREASNGIYEAELEPLDKPGHSTRIDVEKITLDEKFADDIFTQKNLRRAEAKR